MNHSELFKTACGLFKQGESAKALHHLLGEAMGCRKRAETPATMVAAGSAAA
jgi:hypothetical protein